MKVLRLEAENVLRLKAVRLLPDGKSVVVGGPNGAGKSSVLKLIEMALGGQRTVPGEPVRRGASHGHVLLETEDFLITRNFTGGGRESHLEVKRRAGGTKVTSPQALLDHVFGSLSFDPLAFERMDEKEQATVLRKLVGLDFTAQDQHRAELFATRTDVNREVTRLKGALEKMPEPAEDTPDAEVSAADLVADLQRRQKVNAANQRARDELRDLRGKASRAKIEVERLRRELAEAEQHLADITERGVAKAAEVEALTDEALDDLQEQIASVDATNAAVRTKRERARLEAEHAARTEESDDLTKRIADIDDEKARAAREAAYPVPGLEVTSTGVLLNGLPLSQASQAERLRASVAIGAASNTRLKVMLVRDGALLDGESMRLLAEIAEQHDTQLWVEVVGDRDEVTVLLSDGEVSEDRSAASEAA